MTAIYSEYYEKIVHLTREESETLVEIYLEVSSDKGFPPEVEDSDVLMIDSNAYDTVAYHVENFGADKVGYEMVEHLFQQ